MGTRINVSIEHQFANHRDRAATIEMLAPTIPAALAVANYWRTVDSEYKGHIQGSWTATSPDLSHDYLEYCGPGSLFIRFGARLAVIHTGARWRGFLSIPPLQRVHLAAFRSIAQCLGAKQMVFFPDGSVADNLVPAILDDGISQDECMTTLLRAYGVPQPSIDNVSPEIATETKDHVPLVWYAETMKVPPNTAREPRSTAP